MDDYGTEAHARALYRENLWLRELATAVAQELERIASMEGYTAHTNARLKRAMRIRRRLHEGVADEWRPER
jgi:hypothetical protein